jgi:hypothetical protein
MNVPTILPSEICENLTRTLRFFCRNLMLGPWTRPGVWSIPTGSEPIELGFRIFLKEVTVLHFLSHGVRKPCAEVNKVVSSAEVFLPKPCVGAMDWPWCVEYSDRFGAHRCACQRCKRNNRYLTSNKNARFLLDFLLSKGIVFNRWAWHCTLWGPLPCPIFRPSGMPGLQFLHTPEL